MTDKVSSASEKRWLSQESRLFLAPMVFMVEALVETFENADTDILLAYLGYCHECTSINCAWSEYRAAQMLVPEIERVLRARAQAPAAPFTQPDTPSNADETK